MVFKTLNVIRSNYWIAVALIFSCTSVNGGCMCIEYEYLKYKNGKNHKKEEHCSYNVCSNCSEANWILLHFLSHLPTILYNVFKLYVMRFFAICFLFTAAFASYCAMYSFHIFDGNGFFFGDFSSTSDFSESIFPQFWAPTKSFAMASTQ